jgi:hypothetical protein
MKLRLLGAESEQLDEFPPLSLDPPSLSLVTPAPVPGAPREVEHREPDWHGRTARSQYRDSEIYQPLSSMLLGCDARKVLLIAVLALYNGAIGWVAWDAGRASGEAMPIVAALGLGAVAGWAAARLLRTYRPEI